MRTHPPYFNTHPSAPTNVCGVTLHCHVSAPPQCVWCDPALSCVDLPRCVRCNPALSSTLLPCRGGQVCSPPELCRRGFWLSKLFNHIDHQEGQTR